MKKKACFLLLLYLQRVWTDSETLRICRDVIISRGYNLPEYTQRNTLNDVTIFYYDSRMDADLLCPDWLSGESEQRHWKRMHNQAFNIRRVVTLAMNSAIQQFNLTGHLADRNIYQATGCCHLHPNGSYKSWLTHSFNGKDFLGFDFESRTFVAAVPQAFVYKHLRDQDETSLNDVQACLKTQCLDQLNVFKNTSRVTLRKVPEVRIFEQRRSSSVTVTCHVTGFYPRAVQVDWLGPDLEFVSEGVTEVLPNEDGTYQTRRSLKVPQEDVGKHTYTCVVFHISVPHNITTVWVGEKRCRVAVWTSLICICLLVIGLVFWRCCRSRDDGS